MSKENPMTAEENGKSQAFPYAFTDPVDLTLDAFAKAALAGYLALCSDSEHEMAAKEAVRFADALLAELAKEKE